MIRTSCLGGILKLRINAEDGAGMFFPWHQVATEAAVVVPAAAAGQVSEDLPRRDGCDASRYGNIVAHFKCH